MNAIDRAIVKAEPLGGGAWALLYEDGTIAAVCNESVLRDLLALRHSLCLPAPHEVSR